MMTRILLTLLLLTVMITGCDRKPAAQLRGKAEDAADQAKEAGHNVFSGTVNAIDKAKGVGETLMDSAEAERRKIDKEGE